MESLGALDILVYFLPIGLIAGVVCLWVLGRIRMTYSKHSLYAVRDQLILLVAESKLSESSPIFQHYYKRINFILSEAPTVGLDHMLEALLKQNGSQDFTKNLSLAKKTADKMHRLVKAEDEEVRQVVSMYYRSLWQLVVCHSSLTRYLYILAVKGWLSRKIEKAMQVEDKMRFLRFADQEAIRFQPR